MLKRLAEPETRVQGDPLARDALSRQGIKAAASQSYTSTTTSW